MPGERFFPGNNPGGSPGEVRLQKEFDAVKSRPTQNKTPVACGQALKIKTDSESEKTRVLPGIESANEAFGHRLKHVDQWHHTPVSFQNSGKNQTPDR
jgi:hypothetical protein